MQIKSQAYERHCLTKKQHNFEKALPEHLVEQADRTMKDIYMLDTLGFGGFDQTCKEALTKLGVKWAPGSAEQAYNSGLSTQVPVRIIVQLKTRFRGHLTYGNRKLIVEKGTNAK